MEHNALFIGTTPEIVFNEFTSADFMRAFSEEVGVFIGDIESGDTDGVLSAMLPWNFPTNRPGIPSLAQKMLPAEVNLDWQQRWGPMQDPPIPGSMTVLLHGKPSATVEASATREARGEDTGYQVDTTTKTSLKWPVAGTVESTIDRELVGWILQVQARVLRRRLGLPEPS